MLFFLASLGAFREPILQAMVISGAVFGAVEIVRRRWARPLPISVATTFLVALSALPLVFVFAVTVNPTISWDAAVYHLTLPDLYLREGGFQEVPFLVYALWPQAVDLLFGVAMAVGGYVAAKTLHFGFGILVVATLWRTAAPQRETPLDPSRASGVVAGLVASALFLLNDVVLFELRSAYVDLAMAFFALAAFLFLERWLDDNDDRSLLAAGLACGLLASSKITGVSISACLLLLVVPRLARRFRENPRKARRSVVALGLPMVILWIPWLLRTWLATGNPVYPLLWEEFGGPDWSSQLTAQLVDWQRSIGMGRTPFDFLQLPWRVFTAGDTGYENFDGRLTPLWLAFLPLALWRAAFSARARRALLAVFLLFIAWAMGSQQMRFLIPALPILALAVADGVVGLLSIPSIRRRLRARSSAGILFAATGLAWLAGFAGTQPHLIQAGKTHLDLYFDHRFQRPTEPPSPPVFQAVKSLPADSIVVLLNSNHLFHCRPTKCWANSFFEAPQIDEWLASADSSEEVAARLNARGVTHIAWTGAPRIRHAPPILGLLRRTDLAEPVFAQGSDRLWRLKHPEQGEHSEVSR